MKISGDAYLQFGKHAGCHLSDPAVPTDYLRWCSENVGFSPLEGKLLEEEIWRRRNPGKQTAYDPFAYTGAWDDGAYAWKSRGTRPQQAPPPPPKPAPPPKPPALLRPDVCLRVVSAGRRALALKLHPDAGGDPDEMVAVNNAADYLEKVSRMIGA